MLSAWEEQFKEWKSKPLQKQIEMCWYKYNALKIYKNTKEEGETILSERKMWSLGSVVTSELDDGSIDEESIISKVVALKDDNES